MRQSAIVVPSGVMSRARRITRPSRLVVLPAFSPHTDVGRNTSAFGGVDVERAHRHDEPGGIERELRAAPIGEVLDQVGAEQHERVDGAGGRGGEDAGGIEARAGRARCPTPR